MGAADTRLPGRRTLGISWGLRLILPGAGIILAGCLAALGDGAGSPDRIEWIDTHVHLVAGRGAGVDYPGAVQTALAAMDQHGIRISVVMPPPQPPGPPPPQDDDAFVNVLNQHAGRFAFLGGGGSLNPMIQEAGRQGTMTAEVRRRFQEKAEEIIARGAAGFGELTAHHLSLMPGHPYESVPADHPLFLLLADIAGRHDAVIDLHFDLVTEEMPLPQRVLPRLESPPNPQRLRANLGELERLLAHNRQARIVWAHAGSDFLGHWTAALSRGLLQRHPNLYMSIRVGPGLPQNRPLDALGRIKPEWLDLFRDFSDRFVIGGDHFFASPGIQGSGPGVTFSQRTLRSLPETGNFLRGLPGELARKIAHENAARIYKLKQ